MARMWLAPAFDHAGADLHAPPDVAIAAHAVQILPVVVDTGCHIRMPVPAGHERGCDLVHATGLHLVPDLADAPLPPGPVRHQCPQGAAGMIQRMPQVGHTGDSRSRQQLLADIADTGPRPGRGIPSSCLSVPCLPLLPVSAHMRTGSRVPRPFPAAADACIQGHRRQHRNPGAPQWH